jgi:hypothetical protein
MSPSSDELHRLSETVQKLNDRLTAMETKVGALEGQRLNDRLTNAENKNATLSDRFTGFESPKLNDRLTAIETKFGATEGQKLNDRLTAFESQKLIDRITTAETKTATLNDRLITMEAKSVATENQKLNDRLTSAEGKQSTMENNVSYYLKAGIGCVVGLLGLMGVINYATIPSAAQKHADEEVAKAIQKYNVSDAVDKAVKPRLDAEIGLVPVRVQNSIAPAAKNAVDDMMSREGRKLISDAVLVGVKGQVSKDLVKQLEGAQQIAQDLQKNGNEAILTIQDARKKAEGFQSLIEGNNVAIHDITNANRNLDERVARFERQNLDERFARVQDLFRELEGRVSWHWHVGLWCFVVAIVLMAAPLIWAIKKRRRMTNMPERTNG